MRDPTTPVQIGLPPLDPLQAHKKELGADIDISKYVAGGLVVFNLQTRSIKWQLHLDLSTDTTAFRAHIYSNPTLADLDGDGKLEIIVGTSMVQTPQPPASMYLSLLNGDCGTVTLTIHMCRPAGPEPNLSQLQWQRLHD